MLKCFQWITSFIPLLSKPLSNTITYMEIQNLEYLFLFSIFKTLYTIVIFPKQEKNMLVENDSFNYVNVHYDYSLCRNH